jgi:6,7-dimethyl-8-ribityllumazine synthase
VPGSFELPVVAKAMAKSGKFDAVVCIGVVVSYTGLGLVAVVRKGVGHQL